MSQSPIQDALDARLIRAGMTPALKSKLSQLTVLEEVDSTNTEVLRLPADQQHAHAVLADRQTGGRGRRQRNWHSPAGGNIYLSLGWSFKKSKWTLSTLPLVVAIAVSGALSRAGLQCHGIKWPNDILVNNRKLAGILVELKSMGGGTATAVIGVGLNVRMPAADPNQPAPAIDRPWTDLAAEMPAESSELNRNRLASLLLEELLGSLEAFESAGFGAFEDRWNRLDLLRGREIRLDRDGQEVAGVARGIDASGGMLLETVTGPQVFHSGEVSIHRD